MTTAFWKTVAELAAMRDAIPVERRDLSKRAWLRRFHRGRGFTHAAELNAAQEYFTRRFATKWRLHCESCT